MSNTISEAALTKARELMLADAPAFGNAHREESVARFVQQVGDVARAVDRHLQNHITQSGGFSLGTIRHRELLAPLILPTTADPLTEILGKVTAARLRTDLARRGLKIVQADQ